MAKTSLVPAQGLDAAPKYRLMGISELIPDPRNPRKHSREQIRAIARSISTFGFNAPILIDREGNIIAGHGRWLAAKYLGLKVVPVVLLEHLNKVEARAYTLADNKLTDRSSWDDTALAENLKELTEIAIEFPIEATGFELPEVDFRIQSLNDPEQTDRDEEFEASAGRAVTVSGDHWFLGGHRLYCGNAMETASYEALLGKDKASAVFTDAPYNRRQADIGGNGAIKHANFAMASGEMSPAEFVNFLVTAMAFVATYIASGSVIYAFMDWRHMDAMLAAGKAQGWEFLNLCVWVKPNGGMGSFYRSMHELVFMFRQAGDQHINNVQLGRFGRNRTNVWNYPGANSFARKGQKRNLELHPTVKPIALVADAILDCTQRDDIVLDPFMGAGTTILAAERTGRRGYGIEIDPLYVDTTIERWQKLTGKEARLASGETFAEIKAARASTP